ncbi:MAG TPA: SH3 domain-containing protein [Anaerolineales bacterium]|nr:SH3 domain-containing protein [Anaerolineales bacterium]
MDASTRAPGYDLFKLIVALFLLILSSILMWMSSHPAPTPADTPLPEPSVTSLSPGVTAPPTATATPLSPPTAMPPTDSSPTTTPMSPPTATPPTDSSPTTTPMSPPTAMPPTGPSPTATPLSPPTAMPPTGPSPTPTPLSPPTTACEAATTRSHLRISTHAVIRRHLNFRSSPGIRDNWLLTNLPGTQVEIIAGPECVPYAAGVYLWWQVRLPDGRLGWSAESSVHGTFYFMEPVR